MRVITGKYKGRRLKAIEGRDVRPTSEKVKEALFSIIAAQTPDSVFCDLFAGTGALGIEALSRGADKCYFFDSSKRSIMCIRENAEHCGAGDEAIIKLSDFRKALSSISEKIDVFILDPPYNEDFYEQAIRMIVELDLLSDDGIIIAECDVSRIDEIEICAAGYFSIYEKEYGRTCIALLEPVELL